MNKIKFLSAAVIFFITLTGKALPHVGLDYPLGGETFQAGEVTTLQWQIIIYHGASDWDLYFTSDGGSNWETIASDLAETQLSYDWTVPNTSSNLCRIRIVQDNENYQDYNDDSDNFTITTTTDVNEPSGQVEDYVLYPAYPNPFNPTTKIGYSIPELSFVTIKIYDMLGNGVTTLVNEVKTEGIYNVELDALGWTSGIYFYKLQAVESRPGSRKIFVQTKKIILLK